MASCTNDTAVTGKNQEQQRLYRKTPLIRSDALTEIVDGTAPVYLKLDALQPSGSFKDRGMAHLCYELQQQQQVTKIISSSGGNAGLAAATVARQLGLECTVVVPETTKLLVIDKLKALGATVQVVGQNWNQADAYVRELVEKDKTTSAYIPPYEHPLLWTGHSTVIDEIYQESSIQKPGTIIVSVGGGGLLCGVLEGLERQRSDTAICNVIAAETVGAASFGQAWEQQQIVTLPAIDSVATSLGALQVSPTALQRAQNYQNQGFGTVQSVTCTDAEAIDACLQVRIVQLLFARR